MPPDIRGAAGLSLSDWISLAGIVVTVIGLPLALIGAHCHSAVRNHGTRAAIIERLTSSRRQDLYRVYLGTALNWLDKKIGPAPFARDNPKGRSSWGIKSLGVCIGISLAYSFLFYISGWVLGGPGALGRAPFLEVRWASEWRPDWLPRVVLVCVLVIAAAVLWLCFIVMAKVWHVPNWLSGRLGRLK